MYTIANKNNKKTRKISSSSRNKHKSKSKNKHKHKYTIGKTRKYTKSYFSLQNGGVITKSATISSSTPGAPLIKSIGRRPSTSSTPAAAAPVTFDVFKADIVKLFEKFKPDSSDYTPDKLFVDLTIAATSITVPDQQKKALNVIQTMYIFYSNHFPPNVNSPLRKTIALKYHTITVTPLTTKPTLLTTDLGEELSKAIYDKLTAAAKKHTVHATPTPNDTLTNSQISLSAAWENNASTAAASTSAARSYTRPPQSRINEPPPIEMQTLLTPTAAIHELKQWNEADTNTVMVAKNSKLGNRGLPEPPSKFENDYTILFHDDGTKFAWGKKLENIKKRLAGTGNHLEQRIVIEDITKIIPDNTTTATNDTCRSRSISTTSVSKNCVTIIQDDQNNPVWFFSFDGLQTRNSFIELIQKLRTIQMN